MAINRVAMVVGPLVLVPLFIRYLDPVEYGLWITILSITSYLGLLNLGITPVVAAVVTREHARGTVGDASSTLSTALALYVVFCFAAWALATAVILIASERGASYWSSDSYLALWLTVSLFLASLPNQLAFSALRGCKRVGDEQLLGLSSTLARYLLMGAGLIAGLKLPGIAFIHGVAGLVTGIAWPLLARVEPKLQCGLRTFRRELLGKILRPSFWFMVLQAGSLLTWSISAVVIAAFLGPASVPAYSVPLQLAMAFLGLASVITSTFTPHLVSLFSVDRHDETRRTYLSLLGLSMTVAAFGCVGLWTGGRDALEAWGGPTVVPDVPTIVAIGVLVAIQCSLYPADAVLVGLLRHRNYALLAVLEGSLNLVLAIWWVGALGAFGVILASIVSKSATNMWYLHRRAAAVLALPKREVIGTLLRSFVVPTAIGFAVAFAICSAPHDCNPLFAAAFASISSMVAGLALNRSSVRELNNLR